MLSKYKNIHKKGCDEHDFGQRCLRFCIEALQTTANLALSVLCA